VSGRRRPEGDDAARDPEQEKKRMSTLKTAENAIHELGDGRVAWFSDPIRHFWRAELTFAPADPGQDHRSVGTLEPLWNLFDLTREGRPNWDERLSYR
jgi:predicted dithiol-disulfide oxidoreductase (DUF899 family)